MADSASRCPRCGVELPANTLKDDCPHCQSLQAMTHPTSFIDGSDASVDPADPTTELSSLSMKADFEETRTYESDSFTGPESSLANATIEFTSDSPDQTEAADVHGTTLVLPRGAKVRYFGDYEIQKVLGRGGMGVVYKARQISLNRSVALKMIKAGVLADDAELQRFQNEAEAVALLDHVGIVPVYEVGEHLGQKYFSMKLIEGGNLAEKLPRFKADPKAAAILLAQTADAVHHAHIRGILHRDLKPANILVDAEGHPHVTDFGLAKRVEGTAEMTLSGAILGTPAYMSPEQANARRGSITTATDVYGLGAVLYALLTGKAPFGGDSMIETLDAVRNRPPESPKKFNAHVPRDLETICLKCLEKDPRRRYGSAVELSTDLHNWLESRPITARRVAWTERAWLWCKRKPVVAALAAAVVLAIVGGTVTVIAVQTRANRLLEKKNSDLLNSAVAIKASRDRVQGLLRESEIRTSDQAFDWALGLAKDGRVAEGMLWMNLALANTPHDETERRRVLLTNLNRWRAGLYNLRERLDHKGRVVAFAFRPGDGRRIVTASHDGSARLWDTGTGQPVGDAMTHSDFVFAVAFRPDGRRVATGSRDGTARLWDAETGLPVGTVMRHEGSVSTLAFSPDGKRIATGSPDDKTARIWDAETGAPLSPPLEHQGDVDGVVFSPDGKRLATFGRKFVRLWDAETGKADPRTFTDDVYVRAVAFRPDGKMLATAGYEKVVKLWDLATGQQTVPALVHEGAVMTIAFDPEGKSLATVGNDRKVRVWDASTGKLVWAKPVPDASLLALAISPDGLTLATGGTDRNARLWNMADGRPLGQPLGHRDVVQALAFSPDGRTLASAGFEGTARLWDTALVPEKVTTVRHKGPVEIVAFSPDGRILASAGVDKTARLWDARSGTPLFPPLAHGDTVHLLVFRHDGRRVATAGYDHLVRVWDTSTGSLVSGPMGHDDDVYGLGLSPKTWSSRYESRTTG